MSVHQQASGYWYFACPCGVCGRPRYLRAAASSDQRAHASVCSSRGKR